MVDKHIKGGIFMNVTRVIRKVKNLKLYHSEHENRNTERVCE